MPKTCRGTASELFLCKYLELGSQRNFFGYVTPARACFVLYNTGWHVPLSDFFTRKYSSVKSIVGGGRLCLVFSLVIFPSCNRLLKEFNGKSS